MKTLKQQKVDYNRSQYTDKQLKSIYSSLILPRLIEEKMLIQLRQGKISKWFSGYGQEAISVGTTLAMEESEYILPMHRNLGVFTTRGIPLDRLFAQFQGKNSGFTKGRDRSFHFGTQDYNIVGMISHLGPQLGIADGIALASKIKKFNQATIVFTGDGGASEGDFHEALNVAAVWDLPVIFVIENNQWGLSTPSTEQFRCKQFIDKGIGYGMDAYQVDGNNVLEINEITGKLSAAVRKNNKPVILECLTFRMRGHEEASGTKYYPDGIQDEWAQKDPIENFEAFLTNQEIVSKDELDKIKAAAKDDIDQGLKKSYAEDDVTVDRDRELQDVWCRQEEKLIFPESSKKESMRMIDAIAQSLDQSMGRFDDLVIMGQDIAEYGGVFKVTEGLLDRYGKERVRNTPLCESAIVGASLGLSIMGMKAIVEMQFSDFVTCGFNQIVNNLAKIHYRWGQNADVVIRMPTGAGVGAGPYHSQSTEAWFTNTPGLKVVYPATPEEAKGLLNASIQDKNPVLFFEHKALYRSIKADVNTDYFTLPIGKASVEQEGSDLTIITYGMGVHWANQIVENIDFSIEIINLRTLAPLDKETIFQSVQKTGKVLIAHEDTITGGIGGEIAALIADNCFQYLDAPIKRVGALDTPVPFAAQLEEDFLPQQRLEQTLKELIEF